MTLYEIDSAATECVDIETGEIIDIERLHNLEMAREQKIRNIALWMKNLRSDIVALKAEKESFAARQKAAENKLKSLKGYLAEYLNGEGMKRDEFSISFRNTYSCDVVDVASIPKEYIIEQEPKVDKESILKLMKGGTDVPGAAMKVSLSMTLK